MNPHVILTIEDDAVLSHLYGSVLGKTVSVTGSASVYYDMALESDAGRVLLVQ